jgi:hypothetical protein
LDKKWNFKRSIGRDSHRLWHSGLWHSVNSDLNIKLMVIANAIVSYRNTNKDKTGIAASLYCVDVGYFQFPKRPISDGGM